MAGAMEEGFTALIGELRATLGKLEIAIGAVSDSIVWTDHRGAIQWCNASFDHLVGRLHIENLGAPLIELLPLRQQGEAVLQEMHPVNLALKTQRPASESYEFVAEDKTLILEVVWTPLSIGQSENCIVFLIRDITTLKQTENALRQSEQRHRLLVENVRDYAIFMLDPEGRISSWNLGAERMKGYRKEEVIGRECSIFYAKEDIAIGKPELDLRTTAEKGWHEDEGWRIRKDGIPFWANVVTAAIRDQNGKLVGYSKIVRDLSERKRIEERLLVAKDAAETSSRELDAFSYSVAHDLRAPLRAIDGFSKLILERYADKLDETGKGFLQRVRAGSTRMGQLIDDLLSLARIRRSVMRIEEVDLSHLALEITEDLRRTQPERMVEFIIAEDLRAQGDPNLLKVALENLLGNAWKYTGKHKSAKIELLAIQQDGRPVYLVRDNGAGFDMAHSAKLFKPFSRLHTIREFEGTGIGLATTQRIINRHDGRIWCEGQVERGATFYFTLWEKKA